MGREKEKAKKVEGGYMRERDGRERSNIGTNEGNLAVGYRTPNIVCILTTSAAQP